MTLPVVGSARLSRDVMKRREHWLKSIIQWQHEFLDSLTAQEFVDGITGDVLGRGVFVFTPSGEILRLPKVSMALMVILSAAKQASLLLLQVSIQAQTCNLDSGSFVNTLQTDFCIQ